MEERIVDKDDERLVRIKKTAEGETDAVEDTGEDVVFELPEGDEYDEDLVGLTPSQLQEELARRERLAREARERSLSLTEEGNALLAEGKFVEADDKLSEAVLLDGENEEAGRSLWLARTENFAKLSPLFEEDNATALSQSEFQRRFVLERAGERLKAVRAEYEKEERELSPVVEEAMATRRVAFAANKKYFLIRFFAVFAAFVLCIVGAGVSAGFLYSTTSGTPVILCAVFGGLALIMLVLVIVFARKLLVAGRLCRANERLLSTEDGTRLSELRESLRSIALIFGEGDDVSA